MSADFCVCVCFAMHLSCCCGVPSLPYTGLSDRWFNRLRLAQRLAGGTTASSLARHDTLQISSSGASRSYSSLRNQPFWPRILSSSVQALGTAEYLAELPSCSDAEPLIRFAFPLLGCSTSEAVLLGCACVRVVVVGFGFSAIVVHLALNLSTLLQVLEREWWLGRKSTT